MFLSRLDEREKKAFLDLAYCLARCDGSLAESEKMMLYQYAEEMNLDPSSVDHLEKEEMKKLNEVVKAFASSAENTRRALYFEALGMTHADKNFCEKEKESMNYLAEGLGLSMNDKMAAEKMIDSLLILYKEIGNWVG